MTHKPTKDTFYPDSIPSRLHELLRSSGPLTIRDASTELAERPASTRRAAGKLCRAGCAERLPGTLLWQAHGVLQHRVPNTLMVLGLMPRNQAVSVTELITVTGLTREQLGSTLRQLQDHGKVNRAYGQPVAWKAVR